jgi:hypothetical protein
VGVRAPHLYRVLRAFCLGAFAVLARDLEEGADLPFAFEEHAAVGRPALYEYRPLVRPFVDARAGRLAQREDARLALDELRREPAAAIFARAHARADAHASAGEDGALFRTVLLPLVASAAEACGGFDWDDRVFDRAYGELERALFGRRRAYAAVAPLVGLSASAPVELARGIRIRPAATGELASHWPEAGSLLPPHFGREPDRLLVMELQGELEAGAEEPPDAPGELADAVTAVRLATAAAVAAGPVLFERLDSRPFGVRAVVPIAATRPVGEATRLDQIRGRLARELHGRLGGADDDPDLGEALDRWELSLFQAEPFCSEGLREALAALLGGNDGLWAAAMRAALLLADGEERAAALGRLRALGAGEPAGAGAADDVRRALVETLLRGDRLALVASLDEALLGVTEAPFRPRAARAGAG